MSKVKCRHCHHLNRQQCPAAFISADGCGDFRPRTNFDRITESPEALAEAMVFEAIKGTWRYGIGEKISVQAFRSREEAERGAVEYLKYRYEQGWLDWLNSQAKSEG